MSETNETTFSDFEELKISEASKSFLLETTKWAKFLAILGFVGLGLMVIGAFFIIALGSSLRGAGGAPVIMGVVYLLVAVLYFFPTYYLYNFSVKMKKAILEIDQNNADSGFENLKSMFKFMGILAIVMISFYVLFFFVALAIGASNF